MEIKSAATAHLVIIASLLLGSGSAIQEQVEARWFPQFGQFFPNQRHEEKLGGVQARELNSALEGLTGMLDEVHGNELQRRGIAAKLDMLLHQGERASGDGDDTADDDRCLDEMKTWINDTIYLQPYALKMWDSWGRREGGILEGNVRWPGHFYECVGASNEQVRGKWCNSFYGFKYEPISPAIPVDIQVGTCFPSSCDEQFIWRVLNLLYDLAGEPLLPGNHTRIPMLPQLNCPAKDYSWGATEILGITFTSLFLALVVAGTTVDLIARFQASQTPRSFARRIMICFSAMSNTEKILDTKRNPVLIPTLDGIRFISTLWVILGHVYFFSFVNLDNPLTLKSDAINQILYLGIYNGTYSVDTFFVLSGLLVSYLTLKHLVKSRGSLNIPLLYLQRWLRLTPTYAYMILFSIGIYKFLGGGPFWPTMIDLARESCNETWWTNLLYVNNLYPEINFCYGWGWYLACDMQFYILSPLFIVILYKNSKVGAALTSLVIIGSMTVTGVFSKDSSQQTVTISSMYQFNFWYRLINTSVYEEYTYEDKFTTDIYQQPWCRIGAYLVGVLTGWVLFTSKRQLKINKILVACGWVTSLASGLAIVYGLWPYTSKNQGFSDLDLAAFYNAVTRPVWALCVGWVIVACTCGYGGPVTKLLNWRVFLPFSRLTYTAYLIHPLVLEWHSAGKEQPFHYSTTNFVYQFLGTIVITFCAAFIASLLIEWPMQELVKLAFPRKHPPPPEKQQPDFDTKTALQEIDRKLAGEKFDVELSTPESGSTKSYDKNDLAQYYNEGYLKEKSDAPDNVVTGL